MLSLILAATTYTVPQSIHWLKDPTGSYSYATIFGKSGDKCGQITRAKFKDGYVYPWHVNGNVSYATVLQGTLALGFDKNHAKSKEVLLPAGSTVEGLATEGHYARAIGETVFDIYIPCQLLAK